MRRVDLRTLAPERVLIIKPSSLGDVVHALPVLTSLRGRWPDARISWVVNRGLRGLLDGHPHLDEVIPFDRGALRFGPRGLWSALGFARELRERRFDVVIDLQGLLRSGLMTAATGAKVRVGLAAAREGSARFYTHRIGSKAIVGHAVDRLMDVAKAFGGDASPRFIPTVTDADRAWALGVLAGVPRPVVVLNIGARWVTKRWAPESFATAAQRLVEERGVGLVAVGAPEDRPLVDRLKAALGAVPILDLCARTTLPQLAAVAEAADLFLSNDTGPLHLAAATGAPVLGLFTCTKPERTGPYGASASTVTTAVACAGSCVKACSHMSCMAELTPERVASAALRRLGLGGLGAA